jgi:hypothetical protein
MKSSPAAVHIAGIRYFDLSIRIRRDRAGRPWEAIAKVGWQLRVMRFAAQGHSKRKRFKTAQRPDQIGGGIYGEQASKIAGDFQVPARWPQQNYTLKLNFNWLILFPAVAAVDTKISSDLRRLRCALEAVSADLDAIEQRPHPSLRSAAANLEAHRRDGLEAFVNHFVFAVKRGVLR